MLETLQPWGLEVVRGLQAVRTPLLDVVFLALSGLGAGEFYLAAFPAVLWCVDYGVGARLILAMLLSGEVNAGLKEAFGQPRPYELDPSLQLVFSSGHGFPSGHAQNAVVVWGALAAEARRHRALVWAVAALLAAAIGTSRVYLGVHFPIDVVGGWLIGAAILAAFLAGAWWLRRRTGRERLESRRPGSTPALLWGLAVGGPLALLLVLSGGTAAAVCAGGLTGAAAGWILMARVADDTPLRPPGSARRAAARLGIGLPPAFAVHLLASWWLGPDGSPAEVVAAYLCYTAIGAWITLGAPRLFRHLEDGRST